MVRLHLRQDPLQGAKRLPGGSPRGFIHGLLVLLAGVVASSNCGDGMAEPENPTVTGNWVGTGVAYGVVENWRLKMEESSNGTVTGTFSLRVERLVFSGTVSGIHTYPSISLDLDMNFFGNVVTTTYQGQVISSDSIVGAYQRFDDPARTLDLDRLGT